MLCNAVVSKTGRLVVLAVLENTTTNKGNNTELFIHYIISDNSTTMVIGNVVNHIALKCIMYCINSII